MRLLTFRRENRFSLAVKKDDKIVDVGAAHARYGEPQHELLGDVHAVIGGGTVPLQLLSELVDRALHDDSVLCDEQMLEFGPCVTNPTKIIGIGLNYRRHAEEAGQDLPALPVLFSKFSNALAGHREPIPIPPGVEQMDYEVELAVIIGRRARHVSEEKALDHVFGYCTANDVSARDLQFLNSQWLLGKSPASSCHWGRT